MVILMYLWIPIFSAVLHESKVDILACLTTSKTSQVDILACLTALKPVDSVTHTFPGNVTLFHIHHILWKRIYINSKMSLQMSLLDLWLNCQADCW